MEGNNKECETLIPNAVVSVGNGKRVCFWFNT